jgi:SAM-dependent methyltransferase/glycosyltransferase involved in cell wall biosynthesis
MDRNSSHDFGTEDYIVHKDSGRESQLPWTGERYVPQVGGEIQLEHLHRYLLAREYAWNKDVLDIACGEGYGSAILAKSARSVIGVDIATEAVQHAAHCYRLDNVEFRQGSCAEIPLDKDSVDLIVSFETIEHHSNHEAMLIEIKRILRPGGVLIISSPDKQAYSVIPSYSNPFHVRELFKEQFEDLLRAHFKNLTLIAQRIVYGSGIFASKGTLRINDYHIEDTDSAFPGLARSRYLIALASDETLPALSGGLLEQSIEDSEIVKRHRTENVRRSEMISHSEEAIRRLEEQLQSQDSQSIAQIRQLEEQLQSQDSQSIAQIRQLEEQLQSQDSQSTAQIRRLEKQLQSEASQFATQTLQLQKQIESLSLTLGKEKLMRHSMSRSLSWRLTTPLRAVRDAFAKSLNTVKRRAKALGIDPNAAAPKIDPQESDLVDRIRASALFDADAYDATANARVQGFDPALHYVRVGESRGLNPSPAFDPVYYGERYPDVAAWGGNRLGHYLEAGRIEGRRPLPIAADLTLSVARIKPERPTVLVLIHEASRTGAPIIGWNIVHRLRRQLNVVVILMREGRLEKAFAEAAHAMVGPVGNDIVDPVEASSLVRRLIETYRPLYAIANSAETRSLVPGLVKEGVPVVALVHEFSSRMPIGSLQALYENATEIVFPADIVRSASEIDYPFLRLRQTHVLPQGPSEIPRSYEAIDDPWRAEEDLKIGSQLRPEGADSDIVVIGIGYVEWRKGIDLFIAAATAVLACRTKPPVRFVWVGDGYGRPPAMEVSSYLSEQIARSGLGDRFNLVGGVDNVECIYKKADILFLSSRLDPMPNVSIDAALHAIPVVCFAGASGIAEILASSEETRELVVPHLDVTAAASLIGSLAADRNKIRRLGDAVRDMARARFDMGTYVAGLDALGKQARQSSDHEAKDSALILATDAFDPPLYLGERAPLVDVATAVRQYSSVARKYDYLRAPGVHQACTRRPLAGFHPVTYALQNPNYDARTGGEPLAHYLRAGRPEGPWVHPVIRIDAPENTPGALPLSISTRLRVLVHGHFHYTDHIDGFLQALAANVQRCELILTTTSAAKATEISIALRKNRTEADIRVLPNRGRDIGPFLAVLEEAMGHYDLLAHVHGKRSPHVDEQVGNRWRIFLWQHLIGDEMPMVDIIRKAFLEDDRLGLVFPEDPFLTGWDENLAIAQELATRMKLRAPLPASIECPVGTMFWTRPNALEPLLRLGLTWDDYPREPLPIDGTMLHALERLLVSVTEDAGYRYLTTYLPRFVR